MDVRVSRVPVGIIIKVSRRTVVAAWKSKTESLSSRNQDCCRALSVRPLNWNERQSGYRQCNQEKFFHTLFLSFIVSRDPLPKDFLDVLRLCSVPLYDIIEYRGSRGSLDGDAIAA